MVRTPLRLIARAESADETSPEGAAPVDILTENGAVTRRVSDAEMGTVRKTAGDRTPAPVATPPRPNGSPSVTVNRTMAGELRGPGRGGHVRWVVGGVVVLAAVVVALVLGLRGAPATKAGIDATRLVLPVPAPSPALVPPASPDVVNPSNTMAAPEIVRLEITVEQMDADVSLDGNVLAGHRLSIQVPKDRRIHTVSAAAPGYIPFNQQVSFSSDVTLSISLRRPQREPSRPAAFKARPARPEAANPNMEGASKAPRPARRVEPGMSLDDSPAPRPGPKDLDERNPYRP
jgi:hypothetical protein